MCVDGVCLPKVDECNKPVVSLQLLRPQVLLLIDKSGSMLTLWDGDQDPQTPGVTRWSSLYNVIQLISANFEDKVDLGLQLFPSLAAKDQPDGTACLVKATPEVAVAAKNGAKLLANIPPSNANSFIAGGTPARKAIESAVAHLNAIEEGRPQFIVLVTDGAANCAPEAEDPLDTQLLFETYDAQVLDAVNLAGSHGIRTLVIGVDIRDEISPPVLDGSPDNINTYLELFNLSGGGLLEANNEASLLDALTLSLAEVATCRFALAPPPGDDDVVEVSVDGIIYPAPLASCKGSGWTYSKPDRSEIELCGQACNRASQGAPFSVRYNCPEDTGGLVDPLDECSIDRDDCPSGQKCMPYASEGFSTWNALKCFPLDPAPKKHGEACEIEDGPFLGLDNCEKHTLCVDPDGDLKGVCNAMCGIDGVCPLGEACGGFAHDVLNVCHPGCNPLLSECINDGICILDSELVFGCSFPTENVGPFEECMWANACAVGLQCSLPDKIPQCAGLDACCVPFCDVDVADSCPDPLVCVPVYPENQGPISLADVGQCMGI